MPKPLDLDALMHEVVREYEWDDLPDDEPLKQDFLRWEGSGERDEFWTTALDELASSRIEIVISYPEDRKYDEARDEGRIIFQPLRSTA